MNKTQTEKKFDASNAIFRVDVNDVKPFLNPAGRLQVDRFRYPQSMPKQQTCGKFNNASARRALVDWYLSLFVTPVQRALESTRIVDFATVVYRNFTFINHVSTVYYRDQAGCEYANVHS